MESNVFLHRSIFSALAIPVGPASETSAGRAGPHNLTLPDAAFFPKLASMAVANMQAGLLVAAIVGALLGAAPAGADTLLKRGLDLLGGAATGPRGETPKQLGSAEIAAGLKQALDIGSANVVRRLGARDGFLGDTAVRIPLPDSMRQVQQVLRRLGLSGLLDDLEVRLNRAAERAAPEAGTLFREAIAKLTLPDVRAILEGPEDAATRYFRDRMSPGLRQAFRPIVEDELAAVGAIDAYERTMEPYRAVPLVPDVRADLTGHVLDGALEGLFLYLAREEAEIRQNPARRTTELLQRVFGS